MTLTLPVATLLLLSFANAPLPQAPASTLDTAVSGARPACSIDDPDPADCPFCGGNPTVHVRSIFALERTTMLVHATMLR